ncbi:MAG: magnesium transporter [Candidatus Peribacter riflensis]|uniref:Magnesium transporter MgtE n=1 Tax=Candidatus Peribacter riflensis TaxID=1735162 RepID=A0A0S1SQR7_9BACT|nr:MAG: magnesium transporter [Candidatus Peribacter riflensis]OGJ78104.1 MAG: magnesium transporter [Candidatus Peribacteria bacterium RIFOXYC1_FULL_58_8]OGJ79361.1 MAG: magnesium transporter [Candidatus Peribacteria bacterium RIFOXYB1_FULL_57_12]ALM10665.1 MAG: magnesium transporter [Candidatus Peribacter riflensis]ALM11767.1 MAG: magnesium transporter [Candidatus Peribacter riflensis]
MGAPDTGFRTMNQELFHKVDGLLQAKNDQELRRVLLREDAREIADIIDALGHGKRKTFAVFPPEVQADVVLLLSEASIHSVVPRLPDAVIARFLHFLDEDEATDILQRLHSKRHPHILEKMREDRRKPIEKLLTYGPETAGGLMDLNFLEVDPQAKIPMILSSVQEYMRTHHKQIPIALLTGKNGILWIPSRALMSSNGDVVPSQIARPIPVLHHATDQEDVLETMQREGADVSCVIDDHQKIVGVIHLGDLLRVAEAEASEDVYRLGGMDPLSASYLESKFTTIWRKRVVWLSVLFVAELFTFTALAQFESSIAAVTALALFVPLTISTGGNSGSQAATLITRAMALGDVAPRDWFKVMRRELVMGIALGLTLGAVAFVRASLTPQGVLGTANRWILGLVIAQSVAAICLWGTLVGSMLPLLFKRFGVDPGYASSPFVATFVDVTGIVIYFSIAGVFIL